MNHDGLAAAIVRHVRDVITIVDKDGVVRFVNPASRDLTGVDPKQSTGSAAASWVHPEDMAHILAQRAYLLGEPGRTTTTVIRARQCDGSYRHVETHGVNLCDDPDVRGLLYITRDVEDRAQAEDALLLALGAQRVVTELGVLALVGDDLELLLTDVLERVGAVLGAPWVSIGRTDAEGALRLIRQSGPAPAGPGTPWLPGGPPGVPLGLASVEALLRGPAGVLGVLCAHGARPISSAHATFLRGVAEVVSGALLRDARHRAAVTDAMLDELTGLVTRPVLTDRLAEALRRAEADFRSVAVVLVDLDDFKHVNDTWGHAAGDAVLRQLGPRLVGAVREHDTVARYGGDEFVVLCDKLAAHVPVAQVCARIRRACAEPFTLPDGTVVLLSGSVGAAWSDDAGTDPAVLLEVADAAMYRDKRGHEPVVRRPET